MAAEDLSDLVSRVILTEIVEVFQNAPEGAWQIVDGLLLCTIHDLTTARQQLKTDRSSESVEGLLGALYRAHSLTEGVMGSIQASCGEGHDHTGDAIAIIDEALRARGLRA